MLKNNLKIALRNLLKMKFYSSINIFGLSLGIAFCLIMLMYVVNELSYDNYHSKKDRIYRIGMDWGQEGKRTGFAGIFPGVGPALREQCPEVESATRLIKDEDVTLSVNNKDYKEENVFFAEQYLFDIFSFNLISGNGKELLNAPNTVVITESLSKKYFGNDEAIGKTIRYDKNLLNVTGVIKDIPENTHLKMDVIISFASLKSFGVELDQPWNSWGSVYTYFLLREGHSINGIPGRISEILTKNAGEFMGKSAVFVSQKLSDIHFVTDFRSDVGPKGNILYVYIFLSASLLILLLGCFNYINLTTSLYMNRMSEVGVRKVFGAKRGQLIKQFLVDSLIITIISLLLGIILFELLYKDIFEYLGTKVVLSYSHLGYFSAIITGIILSVGIISGGYPAMFLSKFKPIDIMRKNLANFSGKFSFRRIIVVLQFAITIILLIGTFVIYRQIDFMKNSNLGFKKEDAAIITLGNVPNSKSIYPVLSEELRKYAGISAVSGAFLFPGTPSSANMTVRKMGSSEDNNYFMNNVMADYDYVKSLGLEIAQGRDFSRNYPTDENESVIINETAAREMGLENPVGEQLNIPAGTPQQPVNKMVKVIGVVKDFHIKSKYQKIAPMLISITPNYTVMVIRMTPENRSNTIQYIKDTWKKIIPNSPINIKYLDDLINKLYLSEEKISRFIAGFAFIAIIISCLGLLGLTRFIVGRRVKEVGIRKVLGAESGSLVLLLSRQFIFWVLIANIIAWPVTYYLLNLWMQNFAYKTDISFWIFGLSGFITLIIAMSTIIWQTWKVAAENPVKALKYE
jgi:putative ABC transport system permease protein